MAKIFFSRAMLPLLFAMLCFLPDVISVNSMATGQTGGLSANDSSQPSRAKNLLKGAYNFVGGILNNRLEKDDAVSLLCFFLMFCFELHTSHTST
jgi:hypothetical protein